MSPLYHYGDLNLLEKTNGTISKNGQQRTTDGYGWLHKTPSDKAGSKKSNNNIDFFILL